VNIWGSFIYIRDTLHGKTKPNRVSWFLWALNPLIAAYIEMKNNVGLAVLPVFVVGIMPLLVFTASFANKNAYWKLNGFDYLCGFISLLALIVWVKTEGPIAPIALAIISDGLAVVPTLIKAWKYPETETGAVYTTGLFNSLTSFAAIKNWNFPAVAFPLYLTIANILLIISVYRRQMIKLVCKMQFLSNHLI